MSSKAQARYRRSILLGVLALAALVWAATDQFGIPPEDMAWLLLYTFVAVGGVIACAAIAVALWLLLKKILSRD